MMTEDNLAVRVALLESHVKEIRDSIEKGNSQKASVLLYLLRVLSTGMLLILMWIASQVLAKIGFMGP